MDRTPRLAELVVHLTGCEPRDAVEAVARCMASAPDLSDSHEDALEIVARAMCAVRGLDLTDSVDLRDPTEVRAR
jgi:hypothetical protein